MGGFETRTVVAGTIADLTTQIAERAYFCMTAGWDGRTYFLCSDGEKPYHEPGPHDARILVVDEVGTRTIRLTGLPRSFTELQPLSDDRFLMVDSRISFQGIDRGYQNAWILDRGGNPTGMQLHVGDGVNHLKSSSDDRFWAGYMDEGVYGDYPIGRSGLNCFDTDGQLVYAYEPSWPVSWIACVYALNVPSPSNAWVMTDELAIIHLKDFQLDRWWVPEPRCGASFSVAGEHVLTLGSLEDETGFFLLRLLDPPDVETVARIRLVDDAGCEITYKTTDGSGDSMSMFDGEKLYRIRVGDIV